MLADLYLDGRRDRVEQRLSRFCRTLVRPRRQEIEALARVLLEKRTLRSDKQVRLAAGLPPRPRRLSQAEAYRRRPGFSRVFFYGASTIFGHTGRMDDIHPSNYPDHRRDPSR
jgi:hypothetical protein